MYKKILSILPIIAPIFLSVVVLCLVVLFIINLFNHPKKTPRYDPQIYATLENHPNLLSDFLSMFQFKSIHVALGKEEAVPLANLKYIPDGHIAKIQQANGMLSVFVTALNKTYLLQGKTLNSLSLLTNAQKQPMPVLEPQGNDFESSYSGISSVIVDSDNSTLIGIYHAEKRVNPDASDTQTAAIALAISKDGGKQWIRKGKIITGMHELPAGQQTSGAGDPSAIIIGDYLYLYYVDWNTTYPNAIHLARSPLSRHALPGTWQKYTKNGFTGQSISGASTPIILPPTADKPVYYISNPSISFNTFYQKYLGIFETNLGFYAALSEDGMQWRSFVLIFPFPKDTSIPKSIGDIWYSYPTFLSDNTATDMISDQSGYLYYSRGIFGKYHTMVRRKINFK